MKNQRLMRHVKLGLVLVTTLFVSGLSVNAQSLEQRIKVNVPFNFTVGDKDFQAGEYLVQRVHPTSGDAIVRVSSLDGKTATVGMTFPVLSFELTDKGKLVFTRYGDHYFLSEVWPVSSNTGRGFPKSKIERVLARDYPFEIGSITARTTVVVEVR